MGWSLFFSLVLFGGWLIATVVERFAPTMPFLNIFPALLHDSTGFLSAVCVIAIIATLRLKKDDRSSTVLSCAVYVLDLVLINRLYLDGTWRGMVLGIPQAVQEMGSWNWPIILVLVLCAAVAAAMLAQGVRLWRKGSAGRRREIRRERREQNPEAERGQEDGENDPGFNREGLEEDTAAHGGGDAAPRQTGRDLSGSPGGDAPSLAYFVVCVLLIIPVISVIQLIFYRVLPLNLAVPDALDSSLDYLIYIGTVCLGIAIGLLLWIAKKKSGRSGGSFQLRLPAVLAFFAEIIIFCVFFYQANTINSDFLNFFMNVVANNTLAALIVIPIVLFVILDVGISMFINVFFDVVGGSSRKWTAEAEEKLESIQRRIVMFVLNIIIGLLNLLLFIPDFFNEIGGLLLSRDRLFPEFTETWKDDAPENPDNAEDSEE